MLYWLRYWIIFVLVPPLCFDQSSLLFRSSAITRLAKEAFVTGSAGGDRTRDFPLDRRALVPLSYSAT